MKRRTPAISIVLVAVLIVLLLGANLFYGTVSIPASAVMDILFGREVERSAWVSIVLQSRLPQALTAVLAGAALAVSGLMLQTLFQNPLAGPSILGISSGANLGVALVMLSAGGLISMTSTVVAAFAGAMAVLLLILYFSSRLKSTILVLIIGMMVGYLASSGISILNSLASSESVRQYVLWGLGSFSAVSTAQLLFFSLSILAGLCASLLLIKPLNALLLGENYAANLGIHIQRTRLLILLATGYLTAIVTAFCGPVSFIGLAVPHIARLILGSTAQRHLLPLTLLAGAAVALLCNLLTVLPLGHSLLPLNAVTPLLGAPVILYILLSKRAIS
jgi:iron complex transport system permease protein